MCANRPPIPKKLCQHLIGQYVFRQIYRIPIGSETTLELSRQLKSSICVSIFFSERYWRAYDSFLIAARIVERGF